MEFIKETGTKNFALNIDFSVFHQVWEGEWKDPKFTPQYAGRPDPAAAVHLRCHAKYFHVDENFQENHRSLSGEILHILMEHNWVLPAQ